MVHRALWRQLYDSPVTENHFVLCLINMGKFCVRQSIHKLIWFMDWLFGCFFLFFIKFAYNTFRLHFSPTPKPPRSFLPPYPPNSIPSLSFKKKKKNQNHKTNIKNITEKQKPKYISRRPVRFPPLKK